MADYTSTKNVTTADRIVILGQAFEVTSINEDRTVFQGWNRLSGTVTFDADLKIISGSIKGSPSYMFD